jgi:hypothetical protein
VRSTCNSLNPWRVPADGFGRASREAAPCVNSTLGSQQEELGSLKRRCVSAALVDEALLMMPGRLNFFTTPRRETGT